MPRYNEDSYEEKELAYDLRQIQAKQCGFLKDMIIEARSKRDYTEWYRWIDSLFIEISRKLDDAEIKEYNSLMRELNTIINNNPKEYTGAVKNGNNIYPALKKLDMWVGKKMEEYDFFGSKYEEDGL